jgi:hypothetical protein
MSLPAAQLKELKERELLVQLFISVLECDDCKALTPAQILVTILRRKGGIDPYSWDNETLIAKIRHFLAEVSESPLDDLIITPERDY